MKLAVIGPPEQAYIWEQRLKPLKSVTEVVMVRHPGDVDSVSACIYSAQSEDDVEELCRLIRKGIHVFAITPLDVKPETALMLCRSAEEAGVRVQVAQWSRFTSLTEWISGRIPLPRSLYFSRTFPYSVLRNEQITFDHLWLDDLALCLSWISSEVHHIEAVPVRHAGNLLALHLHLRFDNGAVATIHVTALGSMTRQEYIVSDSRMSIRADVSENHVWMAYADVNSRMIIEQKDIEQREPETTALYHFLKSVQMRRDSPFSAYDLLRLSRTKERIHTRLARS